MQKILLACSIALIALAGCKTDDKAVNDAGSQVAEGAENAAKATGDAAANTMMTGKILGAWNSANALKIENADVDTAGKQITLRGYVPSQEMRDTAERIAKDQAGAGYTIENQITIAPPKP